MRLRRVAGHVLVGAIVLAAVLTGEGSAQEAGTGERLAASLSRDWPALYARLVGLERAHGVFYGALMQGRGKVKEADIYRLMAQRASDSTAVSRPDPEADSGYAALGTRAAEILRRTHVFHREVLAIFASVEESERQEALDEAVERYLSRPDVSLPDVPKDMTILYDHDYTSFVAEDFNARRKHAYPTLTGFVWASHWFELAAQEPLEVFTDTAERQKGLQTVTERFLRKLSTGKPPDAYPTELPLAPSIAPGLVSAHERASAIIDNMNLLHDVIGDILVHPKARNVRAAIDAAVALFTDRSARVVEVDDWITMALRHSIFEQGGPALRTMTQPDRNGSGHAQHARGGRSIPPGGMR